jgi:hypothetical protein
MLGRRRLCAQHAVRSQCMSVKPDAVAERHPGREEHRQATATLHQARARSQMHGVAALEAEAAGRACCPLSASVLARYACLALLRHLEPVVCHSHSQIRENLAYISTCSVYNACLLPAPHTRLFAVCAPLACHRGSIHRTLLAGT